MKKLLTDNLDTIFNYSLFITGNREKALDLMQDTMVSILSKKNAYQEQSAFKSWIFTVLKNNYINRYRQESLHREIRESEMQRSDDEKRIDFADPASPAELASDPLLRKNILTAFSQMPDEFRDVCYLVDVEGWSYEEAAKHAGVPIGTVMSRIYRGREFLKNKLRKEAAELKIVSERSRKYA